MVTAICGDGAKGSEVVFGNCSSRVGGLIWPRPLCRTARGFATQVAKEPVKPSTGRQRRGPVYVFRRDAFLAGQGRSAENGPVVRAACEGLRNRHRRVTTER